MLLIVPSASNKIAGEKCAVRVQAVLDNYPQDEIISEGKSKSFIDKHDWRFHDFILMALKYGMVIQTHKGNKNPKDLSTYVKTHNYPSFKVEEKPAAAPKKVYAKRKPVLGNGSVLKPMFNHPICKTPIKPEVFRPERLRNSKLPIIGRLEDARAFDTQYQLERLRELRA